MVRPLAALLLLLTLVLLAIFFIVKPGMALTPTALPQDTDNLLFLGVLLIACAVVLRQLRKVQHYIFDK